MIKYFKTVIVVVCASLATAGCSDYLDLVPEGAASFDNAFSNRINTEKFLISCFSRLPQHGNVWSPGMMGAGDEMWWIVSQWPDGYNGAYISRGYQNANEPYCNFWDGGYGGDNLFVAIRDCNLFIEGVHKPYDVPDYEKTWWGAEAKVLKAYYHFYLMTMYGPIPVIRENLPVESSPADVRLFREPVDDVVNYIVELIDEAMPDLPEEIISPALYLGRISKPIAAAIKAKTLIWGASPLFNGGNQEYALFKDKKGRQLIPSTPDPQKWTRAAAAVKEAIDLAHAADHKLYIYDPLTVVNDTTLQKYTLRYAITERGRVNPEIIWPDTRGITGQYNELHGYCMPLLAAGNYNSGHNNVGAPHSIAEQFYTDKGIPITEDPTWDYDNRHGTRNAEDDHKFYIHVSTSSDDRTANMNFNREPRFHAWLGFDRSVWEGAGKKESDSYWLKMRQGEASGMRSKTEHNTGGYQIKKLVHPESAFTSDQNNNFQTRTYAWPVIRLADLYLLYAEALNEAGGPAQAYEWIDKVRARAGLKGVVESWAQSSVPQKATTKEGLRAIIRQERLIELCFEGQRWLDLRRWMEAASYWNKPVIGWNYTEASVDGYNTPSLLWSKRVFTLRDYLWPLKTSTVVTNSNLEQNPGW